MNVVVANEWLDQRLCLARHEQAAVRTRDNRGCVAVALADRLGYSYGLIPMRSPPIPASG